MNRRPFPTLEDLALYTAAKLLCDGNKACDAKLSNIIKLDVSGLELPVQLRERLVASISHIYMKIRNIHRRLDALHDCTQRMFGDECRCLNVDPQVLIYILPEDLESERKTFWHFAKDWRRDARCRFIMACEQYLIHDALQIWEHLPQTARDRFTENDVPVLVKFWARMIHLFRKYKPIAPITSYAFRFIRFVRKLQEALAGRFDLENVYPGVKFANFSDL